MSNIPDELICPITLEIMDDPVLCEDGFTYERSAIMAIHNSISPMTQRPIDKSKLISNRALKNTIDRFLSSNTEKREREKKIKHEEDQRSERLRLEQIEQQKIRDEHEKNMKLITKYNGENPSFEYGVIHFVIDPYSNSHYGTNHFKKPINIHGVEINNKHKFIFEIKLIESIKNEDTFLTNYNKLVKEYKWCNKYINNLMDHNPFIEFIFDEIIPNIDTIISSIEREIKVQEDTFERLNSCERHHWTVLRHQETMLHLNWVIPQYTTFKNKIPELKSKEYYLVNGLGELGIGFVNYPNVSESKTIDMYPYHNIYLTWFKKKIEIMNSFVSTINAITENKKDVIFEYYHIGMSPFRSNSKLNILESYRDFVFWDTHRKSFNPDQKNEIEKDYTLNYFEPLMLLAKNIIDLTEKIRPEYCIKKPNNIINFNKISYIKIKDEKNKSFLIICKIIYNIIKYIIIITIQIVYHIIKYIIIITKQINYIVYNLEYDKAYKSIICNYNRCAIIICNINSDDIIIYVIIICYMLLLYYLCQSGYMIISLMIQIVIFYYCLKYNNENSCNWTFNIRNN